MLVRSFHELDFWRNSLSNCTRRLQRRYGRCKGKDVSRRRLCCRLRHVFFWFLEQLVAILDHWRQLLKKRVYCLPPHADASRRWLCNTRKWISIPPEKCRRSQRRSLGYFHHNHKCTLRWDPDITAPRGLAQHCWLPGGCLCPLVDQLHLSGIAVVKITLRIRFMDLFTHPVSCRYLLLPFHYSPCLANDYTYLHSLCNIPRPKRTLLSKLHLFLPSFSPPVSLVFQRLKKMLWLFIGVCVCIVEPIRL